MIFAVTVCCFRCVVRAFTRKIEGSSKERRSISPSLPHSSAGRWSIVHEVSELSAVTSYRWVSLLVCLLRVRYMTGVVRLLPVARPARPNTHGKPYKAFSFLRECMYECHHGMCGDRESIFIRVFIYSWARDFIYDRESKLTVKTCNVQIISDEWKIAKTLLLLFLLARALESSLEHTYNSDMDCMTDDCISRSPVRRLHDSITGRVNHLVQRKRATTS